MHRNKQLLLLLGIIAPLFGLFFLFNSKTVSAGAVQDCNGSNNFACIEINLNPNPTFNVDVVATNGLGENLPKEFGGGKWYVGSIAGDFNCTGSTPQTNTTNTNRYTISLKIISKQTGKTVSSPEITTVNLCGKTRSFMESITIATVPESAATTTGTLTGTLYYKALDGNNVKFGNGASATLTKNVAGAPAVPLTLSGGSIQQKELAAGTYTLRATWKPSNPETGSTSQFIVNKNVVIRSGQNTNITAVSVASTDPSVADYGNGVDGNPAAPDANTEEVTIECEGGIPVLGWIICAIAKGADSFANTVESAINSLLSIPPESYGEGQSATDNNGVNGLKTAWSAVRIIASLLLVGVALVMVLSQIFSFDFVSAYTVKKVLPKLVIATILIQLSWVLFTGFIQVIDTISFALRDLLLAPFGGSEEVNIASIFSAYYTNNGVVGAQVSTVGFTLLASTAGLAAIGGGFGLLFAALGVLMAIITAFVTLVIRKVIIIVLLVLSPLALVAWILPNTQKLWSTWWQLFSKLTLMFPLVVLLLTSGKIFAYLTAQQNTGGWISFYIIIVAYFGPFFLIPATFKFAGSLFGKLGAAVGGAGNKFKTADPFDWKKKSELTNSKLAKKSRQADFARQRQSDYANLISGGSKIPGRSRFAQYRAAGSATGRTRASANAAAQSVSEAGKDLESLVGGDFTALNALAKHNSVDEMRAAGVSDNIISRVGKFAGNREYQAAALIQSAGMGKAETEMFKNVAQQYGDDQTFASKIIGDAAYKAKSGGDITNGTLGYNFAADPKSGGAVDWLDYGTNPPSPISAQDAVSKKLKEMQTSEISSLKVKANSSGGIEFADKLVAAHFATNADHAARILSTPNIQLDANVEKLLRTAAASSSLPTSPPPIDVHPV